MSSDVTTLSDGSELPRGTGSLSALTPERAPTASDFVSSAIDPSGLSQVAKGIIGETRSFANGLIGSVSPFLAEQAESQGEQFEHPGSIRREKLFKASELAAKHRANYFDADGNRIAESSRTTPAKELADVPVGSWRIEDQYGGNYGHDLSQLALLDPHKLEVSEHEIGSAWGRDRREDAERYSGWMKEGKQAPPIEVVETDNGKLKVSDGHRRHHAAKLAGQQILAWVSPNADTGKRTPDGKPITTALTDQLAAKDWSDQQKKQSMQPNDPSRGITGAVTSGIQKLFQWNAARQVADSIDEPNGATTPPTSGDKYAPGYVETIPADDKTGRMAIDAKIFGMTDGKASVGWAGGSGPLTNMPIESLNHFFADLSGKVNLPPNSEHPVIDAIASGNGDYLGKGHDGVVFGVGDKVAKMSTTVPYQPFNPGHRTPDEAKDLLRAEVERNNKLFTQLGGKGILPQEYREHGDKAFAIRDRVDIPEDGRFTEKQVRRVRRTMDAMHDAGHVLGDSVQVGLKNGKPYLFDLGQARDVSNDSPQWQRDAFGDDSSAFERFATKAGHPDLAKPLAKTAASRFTDSIETAREVADDPKMAALFTHGHLDWMNDAAEGLKLSGRFTEQHAAEHKQALDVISEPQGFAAGGKVGNALTVSHAPNIGDAVAASGSDLAKTPVKIGEHGFKILDVVDTRQYVEDGDDFIPVPGSGAENECARCGKPHEIHYHVQDLATNDTMIVGGSCAKASGMLGGAKPSSFESAAKTAKRLQSEIAALTAKRSEFDAAHQEIAKSERPEITFERVHDKDLTIHRMGDAMAWQHDSEPLKDERRQTLENGWIDRRLQERGFTGGSSTGARLTSRIADAEKKLSKTQARLSELTEAASQPQSQQPDPPVLADKPSFAGFARGGLIDVAQSTLDAVGVVDPTGIADGVNAGVSLVRAATDKPRRTEHLTNAGLSALGAIPGGLGDVAKLLKGRQFARALDHVADSLGDSAPSPAPAVGFADGGKAGYGTSAEPPAASDVIPAMLTPGEVVLTEEQQRAVAEQAGKTPAELFGAAKVPGFEAQAVLTDEPIEKPKTRRERFTRAIGAAAELLGFSKGGTVGKESSDPFENWPEPTGEQTPLKPGYLRAGAESLGKLSDEEFYRILEAEKKQFIPRPDESTSTIRVIQPNLSKNQSSREMYEAEHRRRQALKAPPIEPVGQTISDRGHNIAKGIESEGGILLSEALPLLKEDALTVARPADPSPLPASTQKPSKMERLAKMSVSHEGQAMTAAQTTFAMPIGQAASFPRDVSTQAPVSPPQSPTRTGLVDPNPEVPSFGKPFGAASPKAIVPPNWDALTPDERAFLDRTQPELAKQLASQSASPARPTLKELEAAHKHASNRTNEFEKSLSGRDRSTYTDEEKATLKSLLDTQNAAQLAMRSEDAQLRHARQQANKPKTNSPAAQQSSMLENLLNTGVSSTAEKTATPDAQDFNWKAFEEANESDELAEVNQSSLGDGRLPTLERDNELLPTLERDNELLPTLERDNEPLPTLEHGYDHSKAEPREIGSGPRNQPVGQRASLPDVSVADWIHAAGSMVGGRAGTAARFVAQMMGAKPRSRETAASRVLRYATGGFFGGGGGGGGNGPRPPVSSDDDSGSDPISGGSSSGGGFGNAITSGLSAGGVIHVWVDGGQIKIDDAAGGRGPSGGGSGSGYTSRTSSASPVSAADSRTVTEPDAEPNLTPIPRSRRRTRERRVAPRIPDDEKSWLGRLTGGLRRKARGVRSIGKRVLRFARGTGGRPAFTGASGRMAGGIAGGLGRAAMTGMGRVAAGGIVGGIASGGAAGGAALGGAAALVAGTGPIGLALAAAAGLAAGLVVTLKAVMAFGDSVNESNRSLARFNGSFSVAFAQLEMQRTIRNLRQANATADSGSNLTRSVNQSEEAWQPVREGMGNVTNELGNISAQISRTIGQSLSSLEKLGVFKAIENKLALIGDGIELLNDVEESARDYLEQLAAWFGLEPHRDKKKPNENQIPAPVAMGAAIAGSDPWKHPAMDGVKQKANKQLFGGRQQQPELK